MFGDIWSILNTENVMKIPCLVAMVQPTSICQQLYASQLNSIFELTHKYVTYSITCS